MPDTYTHPNGHTITHRDGGIVRIESDAGEHTYLAKGETDALRDFLLDELGLWSDDETGALVVTDSWTGAGATVTLAGGGTRWGIAQPDDDPDEWDLAVARWRATLTPPPREPQEGEVWRITLFQSAVFAVVGSDPSL